MLVIHMWSPHTVKRLSLKFFLTGLRIKLEEYIYVHIPGFHMLEGGIQGIQGGVPSPQPGLLSKCMNKRGTTYTDRNVRGIFPHI
jgi:hypothetical protein